MEFTEIIKVGGPALIGMSVIAWLVWHYNKNVLPKFADTIRELQIEHAKEIKEQRQDLVTEIKNINATHVSALKDLQLAFTNELQLLRKDRHDDRNMLHSLTLELAKLGVMKREPS